MKWYDAEKPLKKYYNVNKIALIIDKYLKSEITSNYFASWTYQYMWILNGGYHNDKIEELLDNDLL